MAHSRPCREPQTQRRDQKAEIRTSSAGGDHVLHGPNAAQDRCASSTPFYCAWGCFRDFSVTLRTTMPCAGSSLREIQFHTDAVGIVEEELGIAGARHDALAEFDVSRLQPPAHALDVAGGKGDVIEPSGIFVFLFGA